MCVRTNIILSAKEKQNIPKSNKQTNNKLSLAWCVHNIVDAGPLMNSAPNFKIAKTNHISYGLE